MTKKTKKTIVLLDAHAILHRAYHALPDFTSPAGEPTGALFGVVSMLIKIVEDLDPDYLVACYDLPEPTHRHQAFSGYKATRSKTDDDLVQQIIRSRDIMKVLNVPVYELAGYEADDLLGTLSEKLKTNDDLSIIIASGDMDTLQLIDKNKVRVYTQRKGAEVSMFDEQKVIEKFGFKPILTIDYKGLRGDPSDNIPGVSGVGEGSAKKLVATYGTIENIYKALAEEGVEAVSKKSGVQKRFVQLVADNEEEAQFSKMLATIQRDVPIEFSLPAQSWREGIDAESALALFSELGFKSLAIRFRHLLNIAVEESQVAGISDQDLAEVAAMLWLSESDRTNPSYEDIIDFGRAEFGTTNWEEIKTSLWDRLKQQDLLAVYEEIDKPLLPVITKMNQQGVVLDIKYLQHLSEVFHQELNGLETDITALAGEEFNLNSPKQLGDILYDKLSLKPPKQKKTATGARSTRESELLQMKDMHPIINKILRYRELSKLVSTYVDNLPKMISDDGRLRTTFLPTGTVTGRIGSKEPNLQNIPARGEEGKMVRRGFISQSGYQLVSIDYSQIELRIAAILSGDENLINIFKTNQDVHRAVAAKVFAIDPKEVTEDQRRKAKVINFGILYGMGVNALRGNLGEGTTREAAAEFLSAYFNSFTRLAEYLEETKAFARLHGYTKTMFGRRRYFPGISSSAPFIRASAERMAINAPIQGTEGDILRIALININKFITDNKLDDEIRVLLQVHDELVFEVKDEVVDKYTPILKLLMSGVLKEHDTKGVLIEAEAKVGVNWSDMKAV